MFTNYSSHCPDINNCMNSLVASCETTTKIVLDTTLLHTVHLLHMFVKEALQYVMEVSCRLFSFSLNSHEVSHIRSHSLCCIPIVTISSLLHYGDHTRRTCGLRTIFVCVCVCVCGCVCVQPRGFKSYYFI